MIKIKNSTLVSGIIVNLCLAIFLSYLYYYSVPKKGELDQLAEVSMPKIEDAKLKSEINNFTKVKGIPLNIDPEEIGKQNPYNY